MKILKYADKVIILRPYTTKEERDLLLYSSDDYSIDAVFEMIKHQVTIQEPKKFKKRNLTYNEKFAILVELRNISVGEDYNLQTTCTKCNKKFEFDISFEDVIENNQMKDITINNKLIKIKNSLGDYNSFIDFDIDDMNVNEYDMLVEHIDKHRIKFKFDKETICPYCNTGIMIKITEKLLKGNFSEDTISNFYQVISSMIIFGNYSKLDIDSMLPFERGIYLGLLNEQRKESNNSLPQM